MSPCPGPVRDPSSRWLTGLVLFSYTLRSNLSPYVVANSERLGLYELNMSPGTTVWADVGNQRGATRPSAGN